MAKQIILLCLSVGLCLGAPSEEAVQVPQNAQVQGQINVKPPLLSIPVAQVTIKDKEQSADQKQEQEFQQELKQNAVIPDNLQLEQEDPAVPVAPVFTEVEGGAPAPDLLEGGPSDPDKPDLETANTWGLGWRRGGWGWGGGWGRGWGGWGGYYRPYWGGYYRGHGYGHGWGRGWGYGRTWG